MGEVTEICWVYQDAKQNFMRSWRYTDGSDGFRAESNGKHKGDDERREPISRRRGKNRV